nr:RNA-directed DNA polymerase, eukaryota, reverse transcriptase zinc-binding domain protein [Tanacetum cinerariifolium]
MVRNTSTMRDADGWSWRFKNNKADTTIPVRNPFHKEVEKIPTSFYITNFPDYVDSKRLWKKSEARFKRKETYAELPKKTVENNRSQIPDNKVEQVASTQSKKTYASTSNGDRGSKAERQETKMKQVTLSDHESVQINNSPEIALVK